MSVHIGIYLSSPFSREFNYGIFMRIVVCALLMSWPPCVRPWILGSSPGCSINFSRFATSHWWHFPKRHRSIWKVCLLQLRGPSMGDFNVVANITLGVSMKRITTHLQSYDSLLFRTLCVIMLSRVWVSGPPDPAFPRSLRVRGCYSCNFCPSAIPVRGESRATARC